MPERNDSDSIRNLSKESTADPLPALKGSRWQLAIAGVLLTIWIVCLALMALFS
ncbi:MAG TPA: hypothetical protein VHU84_16480 [Lacipirellulaceae bacterium]|nr:hypothetical protein [Lacipirellulaceae bacterium]